MEYEAKPPKTTAERLHCAAHVTTPPFSDDGKGGTPELVKQDWMAACSASGDPIGEAACMAKYCGFNNRRQLEDMLDEWGWLRWREKRGDVKFKADLNEKMAKLVVKEFLETGPLTRDARIKRLGLNTRQWKVVKEHYRDMVSRMLNGENLVLWHAGRMTR